MKQKLFTFITTAVVATVFVVGVHYASAFTGPSAGTPADPINTSADAQSKKGGIIAKYFAAFLQPQPFSANSMPPSASFDGVIFGKNLLKTYDAFFGKQLYMSNNDFQFKIGSQDVITATQLPDPNQPLFDRAAFSAPLTIDLSGRGNNNPTGKNAMEILSGAMCKDYVTTVVSSSAIEFKNRTTGAPVDVVAKQIRLSGGRPDLNRVLVSTNTNGDAVWATIQVVGNQIVYGYDTDNHVPRNGDSPIVTSQICQ